MPSITQKSKISFLVQRATSPQDELCNKPRSIAACLLYRLRLLFPKISGFALRFSGAMVFARQFFGRVKQKLEPFALLSAAPFSQKSRASPCDFREALFIPQDELCNKPRSIAACLLYRLRLLFPKISGFALRFSGAMVSSSEERYSASDSSICGFRGQERQNFLFFDKECLTFSAEYGILT